MAVLPVSVFPDCGTKGDEVEGLVLLRLGDESLMSL